MQDLKIEVGGLAQLSRALRAIDKEAPKQLRLALNEGAELLVTRTRPKIPVVSGAMRRSLVARSTRTSARVAIGGRRAPYAPWMDFGGQGRTKGRPSARPFIKEGRYVYPTLREIRPDIARQLEAALGTMLTNVGMSGD